MEMIRKPSPRKQEMLNNFFWLRTFLLSAGRIGVDLRMNSRQEKAVTLTVWNAQTAYTQADDDDYNFNIALEAYQMLENGLLEAGVNVEAGVKLAMERNGYTNLRQMKPATKTAWREIPDNFFEIEEPVEIGAKDPWNV